MRERWWSGLLAASIIVVLGSATLMATPARAATFVYVGNTESNEIYVLQLDRQSGDLTLVEKVAIPGVIKPGTSTPMAVSPDRRFLYAGTRGEPMIAAGFAIDPASGRLSTSRAARSPTAWPTSPSIAQAASSSAPPIPGTRSP